MSDSCIAVALFSPTMKILKGQEGGKKYGEEEENTLGLQNLTAENTDTQHQP